MRDRERRLVKVGIAIGRESEGGVRSHATDGLREGIWSQASDRRPSWPSARLDTRRAMAAYGWINEVLDGDA